MMFLADVRDLEACLPCAERFHNIYDPGVPFCKSSFIDYWTSILENKSGFMILCEYKDGDIIGGAGGVVTNFLTSSIQNFVEMFWWVEPEFRGKLGLKLYNECISEAKKRGAKRALMAYMANSDPEGMERLYKAKGYRPFESHMIKDL